MGIFDRVEARLQNAVNSTFARAFRTQVQPVEIAAAIRNAMDDRAAVVAKGSTFAPNIFTVELAPSDYERLVGYDEDLNQQFIAAAEEHAESQRYTTPGRFRVDIVEADDLETGVFRIRPAAAKSTGLTDPGFSIARSNAEDAQPTDGEYTYDNAEFVSDGYDDEDYDDGYDEPANDQSWYADSATSGTHQPDPYGIPEPYGAPEPVQPAPVPAPAPAPAPVQPPRQTVAAGPPRPERPRVNPVDRPWLDIDGDRYPLMGALTIVGRDEDADIILDDPGISRRHTEIRITADGPHLVANIRDLGSTNGTFVNGERIVSQHLEVGDRITVGRTNLTYRAGRTR